GMKGRGLDVAADVTKTVTVAANARMTIAVHALTWLALAQQRGREVLTSDEVAASVNTNPVILRRSLGDLRRAGLVSVRHGTGAGWTLARDPSRITLRDIYDAISGEDPVFAMHHTEPNLECPDIDCRPAGHVSAGAMTATGASFADTAITVVELRQYTMLPRGRDDLI